MKSSYLTSSLLSFSIYLIASQLLEKFINFYQTNSQKFIRNAEVENPFNRSHFAATYQLLGRANKSQGFDPLGQNRK
jgi:hypothetical protein